MITKDKNVSQAWSIDYEKFADKFKKSNLPDHQFLLTFTFHEH